jgi:ATP-dependent helicase/DNAse subunit B
LQTLWNRLSGSVEALEGELDAAFGKRTPIALEHGFRLEWQGTTLKGRIDRIDRLENGTLLLIDYKTGSVDFTPAHVGQGKDLQPWFYLRAAENLGSSVCSKVGGILYYDLKTREVSRGMLREDSLEKDKKKHFTRGHVLSSEAWDSVLSLAQEKLQAVREGVKASRFAPTPSPTLCERCDYFLHCRSSSLLGGKAI